MFRLFARSYVTKESFTKSIKDAGKTLKDTVIGQSRATIKDAQSAKDKVVDSGKEAIQDASDTGKIVKDQVGEQGRLAYEYARDSGKIAKDTVLNQGKQTIKDAQDIGKSVKDKVVKEGREAFDTAKNKEAHTARVKEAYKGYASLQDKGRKAPSEQNRPEDGF